MPKRLCPLPLLAASALASAFASEVQPSQEPRFPALILGEAMFPIEADQPFMAGDFVIDLGPACRQNLRACATVLGDGIFDSAYGALYDADVTPPRALSRPFAAAFVVHLETNP